MNLFRSTIISEIPIYAYFSVRFYPLHSTIPVGYLNKIYHLVLHKAGEWIIVKRNSKGNRIKCILFCGSRSHHNIDIGKEVKCVNFLVFCFNVQTKAFFFFLDGLEKKNCCVKSLYLSCHCFSVMSMLSVIFLGIGRVNVIVFFITNIPLCTVLKWH